MSIPKFPNVCIKVLHWRKLPQPKIITNVCKGNTCEGYKIFMILYIIFIYMYGICVFLCTGALRAASLAGANL